MPQLSGIGVMLLRRIYQIACGGTPRHQDTKLVYRKHFFFVPLWLIFPVYTGWDFRLRNFEAKRMLHGHSVK
jgi:hypothetical protein